MEVVASAGSAEALDRVVATSLAGLEADRTLGVAAAEDHSEAVPSGTAVRMAADTTEAEAETSSKGFFWVTSSGTPTTLGDQAALAADAVAAVTITTVA